MHLNPGFMVVHGNHPESLRDLLVAWMRSHPLGPLEDELVLVQSNGVAQWLKLSLASSPATGGIGIAAALRTQLPATALWGVYRAVLGDLPATSAFDKTALIWRLMRLLPTLLQETPFEPLRRFLEQDDDGRKLHQLAARLADLLDQYQVYRADWLVRWSQGDDVLVHANGGATPVPAPMLWQPRLWRALVTDVGPALAAISRADVHRRFRAQAARGGEPPIGLPRRISVFGISSMPRQALEVLDGVSHWTQVLLCVHNPCEHDWSHIVAEKEGARQRRQRARPGLRGEMPAAALHLQTHPLLAAWGKQGRDYIRLLDEFDQPAAYGQRFEALGHRIDVFEPNPTNTLLGQLQEDIRELRPVAESLELWREVDPHLDDSIAFHVTHSPLREVEVLHDQLLKAFTADPSLRPRDIVVMVPAIADYAPHIKAVFGLLDTEDPRYIPFNVADQDERHEDPLLAALEQLLGLPHSRLAVSEMLDLLDKPAVRDRFDIPEDQLPLLHQWVHAAGIRWGLNAAHREQLRLPPGIEQNSWSFGLRRMLLGYATGRSEAWNGIEPLAQVGGLEAALLGPLVRLVDTMERYRLLLGEPATPADWGVRLRQLLQDFFDARNGSDGALTLLRAQEALAEWEQACEDAGLNELIPVAVVRQQWLDSLQAPPLRQRFFAGGVTFASLMPMRAIPFRRIALLGMNDGDYPRSRPAMDFDLMALEHRAGDRSRREDDRYLFLEALLSAREHLHVSWVGRSIHDNEERPASVLVAHLRDHLASGWRTAGPCGADEHPGLALVKSLTIHHRLQPFHPDYFLGDNGQVGPRLSSFASEWRATLTPTPASERVAMPLPAVAGKGPVDLRLLGRFMQKPVKIFFEQRLDIRFNEDNSAAQDQEPFAIDALENWQLQDELIRVQRAAVDRGEDRGEALHRQLERISRRGELPLGAFSEQVLARLAQPMEDLLGRYGRAILNWPHRLDDQPLRFAATDQALPLEVQDWLGGLRAGADGLGRCRLVLESSGVVAQNPKRWRYDKLIPHWAAHLAGHLGGEPLSTLILSKAGEAQFDPLTSEQVTEAWWGLLEAWEAGMRTALPFSVETGCAWLRAMTPSAKVPRPDAQAARDLVQRVHAAELEQDACFARAWPDFDLFWGPDGQEFRRWTEVLLRPLRDALGTVRDAA